mmetsp:Transcript_32435/g.97986  ORF Transcript_32435/g.97986 Transcript_32435/m.97986 type:complete len:298 (+) Transcript_32435:734-1627(+)
MSTRYDCTNRCSSKRKLSMVQSSHVKFANKGSPLPMSMMSSTMNGSTLSRDTSASFSSSPSPSFSSAFPLSLPSAASPSAFCSPSSFVSAVSSFSSSFFLSSSTRRFFSACFLRTGSLRSPCLRRHSWSAWVHSLYCSLKRSPGLRSSTRCVSFRSATQAFRYSAARSAGCHTYRISSKPSASDGIEKLLKYRPRSFFVRSSVVGFGNHSRFSSSVNSTASSAFFTASSTSSAGSSSSFFSSSFASCFSSSPSFFSSLDSSASAACFRSRRFSTSSWVFLRRASLPTLRRFSSKSWL